MPDHEDSPMAMRGSERHGAALPQRSDVSENANLQDLVRDFEYLNAKLLRLFDRLMRNVVRSAPQRRDAVMDAALETIKRAYVNLSRRTEPVANVEAFLMGIANRYWKNELGPSLKRRLNVEIPLLEPEENDDELHFEFVAPLPDMDSILLNRERFSEVWANLSCSERMAILMKAEGIRARDAVVLSEGRWSSQAEYYRDLQRARHHVQRALERYERDD